MKKLLSIILSFVMAIAPAMAGDNDVYKDGLALEVSRKSLDMIIYYEVGGRSYYNAKFTRPMVPAWQSTASGVTVGFGFDVGYNSPEQIRKALEGVVSEEGIKALQSVSGMKGKNAYYNGLPKVKNKVHMTYEQAETVFMRDSLVRFTKQTANAFNLTPTRLHPHSNGALTAIVYNRGPLIDKSDRRKEMGWIKHNIATNQDDKIPSDIRSMKRIWSYSKLKGLHLRYDATANMFQLGLDERKTK